MRNYTEGRDKLRASLEQNVQKQQDSANFDLNNTYGQMNKVGKIQWIPLKGQGDILYIRI